MKKLFLGLIVIVFSVSFASATTTYLTKTENGHAYKVMKVALDGKSKIVVAAVNNFMPAKSLNSLMESMGGTHAINGGFFCPADYGYCGGTNSTDGLRITNGTLLSKRGKDVGSNKSVFGFDKNGLPTAMAEKEPRTRVSQGVWQNDAVDKIYNGMMAPTLVKNGVNVAVLFDELNNDPKQGKAGNKTFICSTQDKSTVYMGYVDGVTFSSIADYIISTFSCYDAILLDNGGTKAMIHNKKYIAGPGRAMMDAFVVIEGNGVGAAVTPTTQPAGSTTEDLQTAITWMYNQGLTMYNTIEGFLPNNTMTREEASKFFSVFAKKNFNKVETSSSSCNFYDIKKADPTLHSSIVSSCKLGIFQGYKNKFTPLAKLNNAEAITVLMRIVVGKMVEPKTSFYANYLLKAKEFGLVGNVTPKNPIKRGEAAMMIYKAYLNNNKVNAVTCSSLMHDESGICIANSKACYGTNGVGTQTWDGTKRGSCIVQTCDNGYTLQNGYCTLNAIRACYIPNGEGKQTMANTTRGNCIVTACNFGYKNTNNQCVLTTTPVLPTCTSEQHLESNSCVANTRECVVENGLGQQNWASNARGYCILASCTTGYFQSGTVCSIIPTCIDGQHIENNICVENSDDTGE